MGADKKKAVRDSDSVILFSGGMDSLIAWEYLGRPDRLYVRLGHRYEAEEYEVVKRFIAKNQGKINVLDLRSVGGSFEEDDATIPLRNMYLVMLAANMGYSNIYLVAQKEEQSIPDRSKRFFEDASRTLTFLMGREITVSTPFLDKDKVEMVRWYIDNLKNMESLEDTWACYSPVRAGLLKREPCGNCPACFRRFNALILNGYHESWFHRLKDSEVVREYYVRAVEGHYSPDRSAKILAAIKMLRGVKLPPCN